MHEYKATVCRRYRRHRPIPLVAQFQREIVETFSGQSDIVILDTGLTEAGVNKYIATKYMPVAVEKQDMNPAGFVREIFKCHQQRQRPVAVTAKQKLTGEGGK